MDSCGSVIDLPMTVVMGGAPQCVCRSLQYCLWLQVGRRKLIVR